MDGNVLGTVIGIVITAVVLVVVFILIKEDLNFRSITSFFKQLIKREKH